MGKETLCSVISGWISSRADDAVPLGNVSLAVLHLVVGMLA